MKICKNCKKTFKSFAIIDGKYLSMTSRSYCLCCSPYKTDKGYLLRKKNNNVVNHSNLIMNYDKDKFINIVKNSITVSEILDKLGMVRYKTGTHSFELYKKVKNRIRELGLNTKHLLGQGHCRGKTHERNTGRPLTYYLTKHSKGNRCHIKKRLLKEKYLKNECYICGMKPMWRDKPLSLILDHINGVNDDYRIDNLRMLCPNCNAQTDTFCSKNIKK